MPPIDQDELNIGIGIAGAEDFEATIERLRQAIEQAGLNIEQAFAPRTNTVKDVNDIFLQMERNVVSLTRGFASLGKAGVAGFEDITDRQGKAILRLTQLQSILRDLDKEAAKSGTKKSRLSEIEKEATSVKKELNLLTRELLAAQQLDIVLKAKIVPEIVQPQVKTYTPQEANDLLFRRDKKAFQLESQIRNFNPDDKVLTKFRDDEIQRLEKINDQIKDIKSQLSKTTDANLITALDKQLEELDGTLSEVERSFLQLKRLAINSPNAVAGTRVSGRDTAADLSKKLTQQEKAAFALESQLTRLSNLDYKGSKGIRNDAQLALTTIDKLTTEINEIQKVLNNTNDVNVITNLTKDAKRLDKELEEVQRSLTRIRRTELANPNMDRQRGPSIFGAIADGIGIPGVGAGAVGVAGGIAAAGYALSRFYNLAEQGVDKAVAAARANRLLASSATEAGVSFDELSKKNVDFAAKAGLSNLASTELTAKIAQLAVKGNRPQDISTLQKGFLDLGAARGLDTTELTTVVQQIITGQDEGYKKLLLPNPSELFEEYARGAQRTVGSLTAIEKSRIFQERFLERADLFNGTAEDRMQSIDGKVGTLKASFENLAVALGEAFANNPDTIRVIDNITDAIKRLSGATDEYNLKLKSGKLTEEEIKAQSQPGILSDVGKGGGFLSLIAGKAISTVGYFNSDVYNFGEGITDFGASVLQENTQGDNEEIIRQRIIRLKREEDRAKKLAELAKERQLKTEKEEEDRRLSGINERKFTKQFESSRTSIDDLRSIRDSFTFDETTEDYDGPLFKDKNTEFYERSIKTISDRLEKQYRLILSDPDSTSEIYRRALGAIDASKELDEDAQEKLQQDFQKAIIEKAASRYSKLFQDPKATAESIQQTLRDVGSDNVLDKQKKEDLTTQGTAKLDEMKRKTEQLRLEFRSLLIDAASAATDNPFIKLMGDAETAYDSAYNKFKYLGEEFGKQAGTIAKAAADQKIIELAFRNTDTALKLRQEARRLGNTPDTQTDAFQRRLSTLEAGLTFVNTDRTLKNVAEEDRFFAQNYNPYNPKSFLEDKLGYSGVDRLTQDFEAPRRQADETIQAYRQRVTQARQEFQDVSIRINQYREDEAAIQGLDTQGLGLYGQEAIAKARLDRLPTRAELLPRLLAGGETGEEARRLLSQRADASETVRQANQKRYVDLVENQKFIDQNRIDAEERIKNIETNGKGLSDLKQIDEFLNITNELGVAELTPRMRQERIKALNNKAEIVEKEKADAAEQMKQITDAMVEFKKQIQTKGLTVDLGDQAITNIEITAPGVAATLNNPQRPTANATNRR